MAITTKAALAAELRISKARVSQYVKAGMPVRSDGKLDRETALNWIRRNQLSQTYEDKGAHRARKLAEGGPTQKLKPPRVDRGPAFGEPADNPFDIATRMAVLYMLRPMEVIIASAVLEAGGSLEVAYAASRLANSPMCQAAGLVLHIMQHPDFAVPYEGELRPPSDLCVEPHWDAYAEELGVPLDLPALQAFLDANPVWSATGDEDHSRFLDNLTVREITHGNSA